MVSPIESILERVNREVLLSPNNLTHLHILIVCTWTLLPFSGALKIYTRYFGVSHRTFDFQQQLPSGEYVFIHTVSQPK